MQSHLWGLVSAHYGVNLAEERKKDLATAIRSWLIENLPAEALYKHNTWTKEECNMWNAYRAEMLAMIGG